MTRTAAADATLRLALAMLSADRRTGLTDGERLGLVERLADTATPLTPAERTWWHGPLLAYIAAYHPRILDIIARQFVDNGADAGPPEGSPSPRPAHHYGMVADYPKPSIED